MLARLRKSTDEKDQGFTLIELLVVMIIIGILAAIAIPVFLNQQKKAKDTATKTDVSTAGKEVANYFVDGTGTLTAATVAAVAAVGATPATPAGVKLSDGTASSSYSTIIALSKGTALDSFTASPTASTWCIAFTNPNGTNGQNTWKYAAGTGLTAGACT